MEFASPRPPSLPSNLSSPPLPSSIQFFFCLLGLFGEMSSTDSPASPSPLELSRLFLPPPPPPRHLHLGLFLRLTRLPFPSPPLLICFLYCFSEQRANARHHSICFLTHLPKSGKKNGSFHSLSFHLFPPSPETLHSLPPLTGRSTKERRLSHLSSPPPPLFHLAKGFLLRSPR